MSKETALLAAYWNPWSENWLTDCKFNLTNHFRLKQEPWFVTRDDIDWTVRKPRQRSDWCASIERQNLRCLIETCLLPAQLHLRCFIETCRLMLKLHFIIEQIYDASMAPIFANDHFCRHHSIVYSVTKQRRDNWWLDIK